MLQLSYQSFVVTLIIGHRTKKESNTKFEFVGIKENMNINFNQRYQSTEEKIQKALFSLLKIRNYNDISIKEICYEAGINRSSFYAHYDDINDLMLKTEGRLSQSINKIFDPTEKWDNKVFVKLFEFLYKNKDFYNAYLNTNEQTFMEVNDFTRFIKILNNKDYKFDKSEIVYHMAFFAGGIKAMSKSWIKTGCKETPEQMSQILMNEYNLNSKYFETKNT